MHCSASKGTPDRVLSSTVCSELFSAQKPIHVVRTARADATPQTARTGVSDPNLVHLIIRNISGYTDLVCAAAVCKTFQTEVSQSSRWQCISTQDLLAEVLGEGALNWEGGYNEYGSARRHMCTLASMLRGILLRYGPSTRTLQLVQPTRPLLGLDGAEEIESECSSEENSDDEGVPPSWSAWWADALTTLTWATLQYLSDEIVPNLTELEVTPRKPIFMVSSEAVRCLARLPELKVLRLRHIPAVMAYFKDLDWQPLMWFSQPEPGPMQMPDRKSSIHHEFEGPEWALNALCDGDIDPADRHGMAGHCCSDAIFHVLPQQQSQPQQVSLDLQELYLEDVFHIDCFDGHSCPKDELYDILGHLSQDHLRRLTIKGSFQQVRRHDLEECETPCMCLGFMGLWALSKLHATLRHLDLSGVELVSDPASSGLPQHQAAANPATLAWVAGMVSQTGPLPPALTLLDGLDNLVTLNLSKMKCPSLDNDVFIGMHAWKPSQLEGLNLRCPDSWLCQPDLLSALQYASNLQRLNIGCCDALNDEVLRQLPTCCPKLRELDVCYCSNMTSKALMACCGAYPANQFTALGCNGFSRMTDADVIQLVRAQGANLWMLGIGSCYQLTDNSLRAVEQHCPLLKTLYMQELPKISSTALLLLKQACPGLEEIEAAGCDGLQSYKAKELLLRVPVDYKAKSSAC